MLLSKGNEKVKALIFDLPTFVCGNICEGCYSVKSEKRFPNCLKKRNENYQASLWDDFVDVMVDEIKKSKKYNILRIHSSGDFYSQEYIDKWTKIIELSPATRFYAYTKKIDNKNFDFYKLASLDNFNLINSITPIGYNFGNEAYCKDLVDHFGYILCPCKKGIHIKCMVDCLLCLTESRVCFLKH